MTPAKTPKRRRQRLVLIVCAWAFIVPGCGWTIAHMLLGHWTVVLPTAFSVLAGVGILMALRREAAGLALLLFCAAGWVLIGLLALTLDIPSEAVPRGIHHYLLPLFIAQRFVLQGNSPWVHNGVPLVSLLLFGALHLAGNPLQLVSPMSEAQRLVGLRVTALLSLMLCGLLLRLQRIELRERAGMPVALAKAIADGALQMRFRPHCDAALRPRGAVLLPHWPLWPALDAEQLRGLAARSGLLAALADWERRSALATLREWASQPALQGLQLAIPMGAVAQGDGEALSRLLADAVSEPALAARLGLEVDESLVAAEPEALRERLQVCRDAGLRISIDNFGSGRSSLAYLESLPVDALQLDDSLVLAAEADPRGAEVLASTIALARRLGLRISAKGASSAALQQRLRDLGCDHFLLPGEALTAQSLQDWALAREASP